jgi:TRAP-type C4-dicarboxylate transport system substrate-binding protein
MGWKNREIVNRSLLGIMLVIGAIGVGISYSAPKHTIRLGTLAQRGTTPHKLLIEMGEKWRDAPGGGVRLIIYPDGTQGSEVDMVRRMRVGQLQAAMLTASGLAEIEPDLNALQSMPLVYRSFAELEYVREQLKTDLESKLAAKGFVVVFWGDIGWVRIFSRNEARFPDDFKKMKVLAGVGNYNQIQLMKQAGFDPVSFEWNDVLMAIQTGGIDAVQVPPLYALAGQYYRGLKYMLEINWAPLPGAVVVTKRAWDPLSAETRQAMLKTGREAGLEITAQTRRENQEAVQTMQNKHGLIVHTMTPEMQEKWEELAESLRPAIRGKLVPEAMFDRVLKLLEEYRNSHNDKNP